MKTRSSAKSILLIAAISQGICQYCPAQSPSAIIQTASASQDAQPVVHDAVNIALLINANRHLESVSPENVVAPAFELEFFEERALQTHPLLVETWNRILAAQGEYIQFGLQPNPEVGYNGQQIGSKGQAEQHGIQVSQQLIRKEKIAASQAAAAAEIQRLRCEWEVARLRVQTDLRIAFTKLVAAQSRTELTEGLVSLAQQTETLANQLRDAKEASKADVLQASIELEQATLIYESARNTQIAAWQELASLTCMPLDSPSLVRGSLESEHADWSYCDVLETLLAESPERKAAMSAVNRNRFAFVRARQEPRPNLTVQGLVNWRDNGIGGAPDGGVLVTIPIPVWNKNQGASQRALGELRASEQALVRLDLELQSRLAAAYERYATATAHEIRYRDKILPASEESLRLTRIATKEGEASLSRLLLAQKSFFEQSLQLLNARLNRKASEIEIDGMLLLGSLQSRPQ